jgi:hypothetical protein
MRAAAILFRCYLARKKAASCGLRSVEQQKQAAEVLLWQKYKLVSGLAGSIGANGFPQPEFEVDIDKSTIAGNVRSSLFWMVVVALALGLAVMTFSYPERCGEEAGRLRDQSRRAKVSVIPTLVRAGQQPG